MGIPKSALRGAICRLVKTRQYSKYIIPCTGRFAVAETFVSCGIDPADILTSDMTLFSSLVGYYVCGYDIAELGVTTNDVPIQETVDGVAEVLYQMKIAKIPSNTYYNEQLLKDLTTRKQEHIGKIVGGLEHLKTHVGGIQYSIQDMRDVIKEHDDAKNLIFLDPPVESKNDYVKMFAAADIDWIDPPIKQFDPTKDFATLCDNLIENNADVVIYLREHNKPNLVLDDWHCFFAAQDSHFKLEYLYSNKPELMHTAANRARFKTFKHPIYPVLSDNDEITANSNVQVVQVDEMTAMYYRDLFVHRFGFTSAEMYFVFLVDGKVFSVRGLIYRVQNPGSGDRVREAFGLVRSNNRYRHIGRLAMRLLTSVEFKDLITQHDEVFEKKYVISTTVSKYPVAREDEGILYLYDTTQTPDGLYYLHYEAEFKEITFQECLADWLKEEENYGKDQRPKRKRNRSSARSR